MQPGFKKSKCQKISWMSEGREQLSMKSAITHPLHMNKLSHIWVCVIKSCTHCLRVLSGKHRSLLPPSSRFCIHVTWGLDRIKNHKYHLVINNQFSNYCSATKWEHTFEIQQLSRQVKSTQISRVFWEKLAKSTHLKSWSRKPEITQFGLHIPREENIFRLDIPVAWLENIPDQTPGYIYDWHNFRKLNHRQFRLRFWVGWHNHLLVPNMAGMHIVHWHEQLPDESPNSFCCHRLRLMIQIPTENTHNPSICI